MAGHTRVDLHDPVIAPGVLGPLLQDTHSDYDLCLQPTRRMKGGESVGYRRYRSSCISLWGVLLLICVAMVTLVGDAFTDEGRPLGVGRSVGMLSLVLSLLITGIAVTEFERRAVCPVCGASSYVSTPPWHPGMPKSKLFCLMCLWLEERLVIKESPMPPSGG